MTAIESQLWRSVYASYNKDYAQLDRWVDHVTNSSPEEVLKVARSFTDVHLPGQDGEMTSDVVRPRALTLGFSPQVLVGILSLHYDPEGRVTSRTPVVTVITSPEVMEGTIPPARHSHQILKHFAEYVDVKVTLLVPSGRTSATEVVNSLAGLLKNVNAEVLDISGGTQLVPIAALKAGVKWVTYGYPNGEQLIFYPFRLS